MVDEILNTVADFSLLIHCGLDMPYGDIDMDQHWFR